MGANYSNLTHWWGWILCLWATGTGAAKLSSPGARGLFLHERDWLHKWQSLPTRRVWNPDYCCTGCTPELLLIPAGISAKLLQPGSVNPGKGEQSSREKMGAESQGEEKAAAGHGESLSPAWESISEPGLGEHLWTWTGRASLSLA